jgi:AraC family transcriptional regulator
MAQTLRQPYLFPADARLGVDNVVLEARARRHKVDNYSGPLSIKTVLKGEVAWIVNGRELMVDPSSFLILAEGEPYSMNIDSVTPVETCCVFFAPRFVERVALDTTSPLQKSLDVPDRSAPALPYLSALHQDCERTFAGRVQSLGPRCKAALTPSGFEEDFLVLATELLDYYAHIRQEAARLPAAKHSTRVELYRRLLVGRDYIHSHVSGPLSLEAIARAAGVSLFHFHRGFTRAFEQTPHAYITGLRLDRARRMLESGTSVIETTLESGFSSPSAFARLFRVRFGEAPSVVRTHRRKLARSRQ